MNDRLSVHVVTGTRAEYGLLRPLLGLLAGDPAFDPAVIVTGMHLSPRFGLTVREIDADGFRIAARIPVPLDDDTEVAAAAATAEALAGFGAAFALERPDLVVVLGDRLEVLAAAVAALIARVPLAHVHGGELTEGAVDDAVRHAVTKMSHLHFAATETYRRRVIQLGEDPARVFTVGALGVDNALHAPRLTREQLERDLGPVFGPRTAVVTYHPVTLEDRASRQQMIELTAALEAMDDLHVVFTAPNADPDHHAVFESIESFVGRHPGTARSFVSLGSERYLSLLREADVCVGNSSSGIIEAPAVGVPTVDIGDRQRGRERAKSVLHAEPERESIAAALRAALAPEARKAARHVSSPYGDGHAAERIAAVLKDPALTPREVKKRFFDLPGDGREDLR